MAKNKGHSFRMNGDIAKCVYCGKALGLWDGSDACPGIPASNTGYAKLVKKAKNKRKAQIKAKTARRHVDCLTKFYLDLEGEDELTECEAAVLDEAVAALKSGSWALTKSQSLALCKLAGWCFYNCDLVTNAAAKHRLVQSAVWVVNRFGK